MIQSMTGYATVVRELPRGSLVLELRSVNSRFLDLQFRIAEDLRAVEPALRDLLNARLNRGKVDCRLAYTSSPLAQMAAPVDAEALKRLAQLSDSVRRVLPDAAPLRVVDVLRWPGVMAEDGNADEAMREAAVDAMHKALDELVAARTREGDKLRTMLLERVQKIRDGLAALQPAVPQAIAAYQEKLTTKLREVLSSADEDRIRQEIALYGVKIDVAEELSRLAAHLDEVERVLRTGGSVGKRLDFLMQELNREANTLGSKSVSKEVSAAALEFKLLIEQMREQVQNLE